MRTLLLSLAAAALAGCASTPVAEVPRHLFADARYLGTPRPPAEGDIFALSDEMREFADTRIAADIALHGTQNGLAAALRRDLRLEYEAASTTPAAQTFAARSGNCLSLVIMFAAFARYLDVPVTYQNVYDYEAWSRSRGIAFLSAHVNLRLGRLGADGPTIDLVPTEAPPRSFARPVEEQTIRAMYFNNRAAEAIVDGQPGTAYWWARAAVETAPSYASAINTLGVIYLREGQLEEAERALRHVLEREPANVTAMKNLANALERDGRGWEAEQLQARLALIEPYPPFYFLDQGLAALARGEHEAARDLFNRERRRMPYNDEVHFALAVADFQLGDVREARAHLNEALKYSTTREQRDIYGAKLNYLKSSLGVN